MPPYDDIDKEQVKDIISSFKEGSYYTYTPDPSNLYREGIAVIVRAGKELYASDTVWRHTGGHSGDELNDKEILTMEYMFNPNEEDWIPADSVDSYNEGDYHVVTSRKGMIKKYWVRGKAVVSENSMIEVLGERMDKARQLVEDAMIAFDHARREYERELYRRIDKTYDLHTIVSEINPERENESEQSEGDRIKDGNGEDK